MYHVRSPGRVNLVGGHTDYSGGYVLAIATDLATTMEARPADSVTVTSEAMGETRSFDIADPSPVGDWTDYVRGCYAVLQDAGYEPGGFEGSIDGDLPLGAGLSSSASLELAVLAFLGAAYDLDLSRKEIARLGHRVETEFVDVPCGILDQFAVALSKADHALFLDTETEAIDRVHFPEELAIVVFDTGRQRSLPETPYAERRAAVEQALEELDAGTSKAVDLADLNRLDAELADPLGHVVRENTRVRQALGALDEAEPERLGEVLLAAHRDLAANFGASTPELDWAVETAVEAGAYGARVTGAGWGGSVVALVDVTDVGSVREALESGYATAFPDRSGTARVLAPSDGVTVSEQ